MRKLTITLHGTLTFAAHRTFEIEVSDDSNVVLLAPDTFNDLADFDLVPWQYSESGYLAVADFSIETESVTETPIHNKSYSVCCPVFVALTRRT